MATTSEQTGDVLPVDGVQRTILSPDEWRSSLETLQTAEKDMTRALDALAARRRQAPWMKMAADYRFVGPDGECTLLDLFADRSQLITYHHMLHPSDPSPCSGCCMVGDHMPHLAHLHARDTSLAFVSKAPYDEIAAFKRRMDWNFPWFETCDDFNPDVDVTDGFGVNVFYRSGSEVYRTYFTTRRGVESLGSSWTLLDITPLGRQESWEVSPAGTEQSGAYQWWRLHDEYPDIAT